jgi:hypothetical protein
MPDDLEREVRDLARRVAALERLVSTKPCGADCQSAADFQSAPAPEARVPALSALPTLPLLGRALLGLAGAYLLRALTESATFSPRTGVAIGLLYALFWLVWAARTPAPLRIETALHSLTSVLVLSPLLWEATLRFHAISTWTAGAILLLFTVFGLTVSWRKDLLIVATITTLAGLGTAAGLLMATHDVLPFTFVFLATAAAIEASACLNHWLSERWLAATTADLSVLLATWLVTNAHGLPAAYAPIPHSWLLASQVSLLAIYLSSTIIRTLLRGFTFTAFETAQCALVFLIGVGGGLRLSGQSSAAGALALACAAACYLVSFALLDRRGPHGRNFYTYSTFGILLALAGSRILLSGAAASGVWLALAIACIWAGGFFGRLTLQVHGAVYLLLALLSSGALEQAGAFLLGAVTWPGGKPAAIAAGALASAFCYLLAARHAPAGRGTSSLQAFRLVVAGALVWLTAGIAAGVLGATLRTGVLAATALLLAWAGSRWNRLELSRLIYPVMIAGAYRLVMEDLHQDRKAALFLSLLLYGAALMLLPRLHRTGD